MVYVECLTLTLVVCQHSQSYIFVSGNPLLLYIKNNDSDNDNDNGNNNNNNNTVESRFLKPSVSRTSRYLEPNLVSLGFASLKLYNFTPDFSNPRFLETPDNSNQFWLLWDKLTLDNWNLRKFPNHLVRMSITFTPLNKLALLDKLFPCILITQQASHKSVISLKGKMTASDCQHSVNWAMQSA